MALTKSAFTIVLALASIGIIATAFGVYTSTRTFSNSGSLSYPPPPPPPPPPSNAQIGVYSDSACQNAVTNINWGTLSPGSVATQTVYVRNEGNVGVTLSMATTNWSSQTAQNYINVTWDKEGYSLTLGSVATAVLTLSVSASISGITSFSFNVTITGTG
jgi:hypothetical protein